MHKTAWRRTVDSVQAAIRSSPSRMKGRFGSPINQFHGVLNHLSKLRGGILPLFLDPNGVTRIHRIASVRMV